ncbi:glycoside hydrolase [Sphingomonas sp. Leaf10]|nr:glycoside hydrolase [Sphingomonas sp. Leaf10]
MNRVRMPLTAVALTIVATMSASGQVRQSTLPRISTQNGRHALVVDGAPFLMLGVQANNSSNYPAMLPQVWPMVERLHANTLEIPVAWEQIEPVEGQFDFSYLDALLPQARERGVKLVLLWFGTWKNTSPGYVPTWVKRDNVRFPRMRTKEGKTHYALSPHGEATHAADKKAFVALMRYLKDNDADNTVIMVQPENEVGVYQQGRDHSAKANRLFASAVPTKLGKRGTWTQAFGDGAEAAFNAWHTARYIDDIAAAGKAIKPLPMYVNAAVGDPFAAPGKSGGASGGPDWQVIDVWKAAAPHIDLVAPDLYTRDAKNYVKFLDHYNRPDNALMVPETGNAADFARFLWPTLGRGGIGWAPFGMDETGYSNHPLGAVTLDNATLDSFARPYAFLKPMMRGWARLAALHPGWGTAKGAPDSEQSRVMGKWKITAKYGEWQFGSMDSPWLKAAPPPNADQPVGGMAVLQVAADQFIIVGTDVRVNVGQAQQSDGDAGTTMKVEEGILADDGSFRARRVMNGDQTDYGLNFTAQPMLLRVTMGTYR